MNKEIFISYRHRDSQSIAGRIYDYLNAKRRFKRKIFMEVDSVLHGQDFEKKIRETLGQCKVLILVIGNQWLTVPDEQGVPLLRNPSDFVRIEVRAALQRNICVIPVLVENATMPYINDLPDDIQPLAKRKAIQIRHEQFENDARILGNAVRDGMTVNLDLMQIKNALYDKSERSCEEMLSSIKSSIPEGIVSTGIHMGFTKFRNFRAFFKHCGEEVKELPVHLTGLFNFLILGEPGNGKTYSLLKWMQSYNAHRMDLAPGIPFTYIEHKNLIYISLSSWRNNENLESWLAFTISKKFELLHSHAIQLVQENHIVPCFDDLDEVQENCRLNCLTSILEYAKNRSLVFVCRTNIFKEDQNEIINMGKFTPVYKMNLIDQRQILEIIRCQNFAKADWLGSLKKNEKLLENLEIPLFLNLFIRTIYSFDPQEKEILFNITSDKRLNLLWLKYETIITAEKRLDHQSWMIVRNYLETLANRIRGNTFFLDQLQPRWLPSKPSQFFYYLLSRVLSGIVLAVAVGFLMSTPIDLVGNGIFLSFFATLLTLLLLKLEKIKTFAWILTVPLFSLVFVIISGLYQGSSIPTAGGNLSSLSGASAGMLPGILFGVIFGFRKSKQSNLKDIWPAEQSIYSWTNMKLAPWKAGFFVGFLTGLSGVFVRQLFRDDGRGKWQFSFLKPCYVFLKKFLPAVNPVVIESITLFIVQFLLAFISSFIVFVTLAARDRHRESIDYSNKSKYGYIFSFNFGLKRTLKNSLVYGLVTFALVTAVYGNILAFIPPDFTQWEVAARLAKAAAIGTGMGIIAFLWFGGFEVIQHWTLRIYLSCFRIVPWHFEKWIKKASDLGYIQKEGASLHFRHATLIDFFKTEIGSFRAKARMEVSKNYGTFSFLCVASAICLVLLPFVNRSLNQQFWKKPNEIIFSELDQSFLKQIDDSTFRINRSGFLSINIKGYINAGSFVGYVGPEGTPAGYLGFPSKEFWGNVNHPNHAALLYKLGSQSQPRPFKYTNKHFGFWQPRSATLKVKTNDTLRLLINDSKWQDNQGHFWISMRISANYSNN